MVYIIPCIFDLFLFLCACFRPGYKHQRARQPLISRRVMRADACLMATGQTKGPMMMRRRMKRSQ